MAGTFSSPAPKPLLHSRWAPLHPAHAHHHEPRFSGRSTALFESASAQISGGWKVGLIGRNGTGKSTLLRLIREDIERPTNDAAIRLNTGARLGWVAQEVAPTDETILDVVLKPTQSATP